ncbi:hypothetical protein NDU88_007469 [Pleurodeles waltl]|uniref:Uncharacterized protein n=1 Tax=Pleurodeles waltl TaxID=8319 RepID=A0AAV7PLF9_PLEWA|nr:hypothetical protein NDU88_007469 [Pleurodeles waltl]
MQVSSGSLTFSHSSATPDQSTQPGSAHHRCPSPRPTLRRTHLQGLRPNSCRRSTWSHRHSLPDPRRRLRGFAALGSQVALSRRRALSTPHVAFCRSRPASGLHSAAALSSRTRGKASAPSLLVNQLRGSSSGYDHRASSISPALTSLVIWSSGLMIKSAAGSRSLRILNRFMPLPCRVSRSGGHLARPEQGKGY